MTDIPPDPPPHYPTFRVSVAYAEAIRAAEAKGIAVQPLTARQVRQAQRRLNRLYSETEEPRLTHARLKVLRAFLDSPTAKLSGVDIHKQSGVFTGTLYPALLRFEAAGWLASEWEDIDPKEAGRPRKRFYRLTPTGLTRANAALASDPNEDDHGGRLMSFLGAAIVAVAVLYAFVG